MKAEKTYFCHHCILIPYQKQVSDLILLIPLSDEQVCSIYCDAVGVPPARSRAVFFPDIRSFVRPAPAAAASGGLRPAEPRFQCLSMTLYMPAGHSQAVHFP